MLEEDSFRADEGGGGGKTVAVLALEVLENAASCLKVGGREPEPPLLLAIRTALLKLAF